MIWERTSQIAWFNVVTERILMQKWVSEAGEIEWREVGEVSGKEIDLGEINNQ
jgi:hypothetical protein